jgi:hypothetical protein
MLSFLTGTNRDCERVSRRSFLQVGSLAGLGVTLPMALAAKRTASSSGRKEELRIMTRSIQNRMRRSV